MKRSQKQIPLKNANQVNGMVLSFKDGDREFEKKHFSQSIIKKKHFLSNVKKKFKFTTRTPSTSFFYASPESLSYKNKSNLDFAPILKRKLTPHFLSRQKTYFKFFQFPRGPLFNNSPICSVIFYKNDFTTKIETNNHLLKKVSPIALISNQSIFEKFSNREKNEVGVYSLANYFAISEFAQQRSMNKSKSFMHTRLDFSKLPWLLKNKKSLEIISDNRETPLRFYEGNNLMPFKFNDSFKFNFKDMNLLSFFINGKSQNFKLS